MKFIKNNIKTSPCENVQYDYKLIVNKKYLLNIFTWMPFLYVKFIMVEIEYIPFLSPTCSSLIPMSVSWATGPSQKYIYPWITLHPPPPSSPFSDLSPHF